LDNWIQKEVGFQEKVTQLETVGLMGSIFPTSLSSIVEQVYLHTIKAEVGRDFLFFKASESELLDRKEVTYSSKDR
jgi:hypothetical protein